MACHGVFGALHLANDAPFVAGDHGERSAHGDTGTDGGPMHAHFGAVEYAAALSSLILGAIALLPRHPLRAIRGRVGRQFLAPDAAPPTIYVRGPTLSALQVFRL